MIHSEQIAELAKALAKAQGAIKNAVKDSTNPHFKSKYADLASVWDAVREPLTSNGLSVVQTLSNEEGKVVCTTMLLHESGQWIKDTMSMSPQQNTPQGQGSCATYLRRYSLMSITGVAPDDDDGNAASTGGNNNANNSNSAAAKVVVAKNAQPSLDKKIHEVADNPASRSTFSRKNTEQLKTVVLFLEARKCQNALSAMTTFLEGKEWSKESLAAAWAACNPEAPDQPKE